VTQVVPKNVETAAYWLREVERMDPDGNRLRFGQR